MEYDLILSLGGSCAVANQLKVRGLRTLSLPFDWVYCRSAHSLNALKSAFENDFSDWMLDDNMVELPKEEYDNAAAKYQYEDRLTGYRFIHDFPAPKETALVEVREKYKRRIFRLYEFLKEANSIALCFDSGFGGCAKNLEDLRDVLLKKFGENKCIDCYWVEFGAKQYQHQERVGNVLHSSYPHPKPLYLFGEFPTFEFAFLDEFKLTGRLKGDNRMKGRRFYLARTHKGVKLWLFRFCRPMISLKLGLSKKEFEIKIGG